MKWTAPVILVSLGILTACTEQGSSFQATVTPPTGKIESAEEIDSVNDLVFPNVNDGVYRAGFATTQPAYERAVIRLFATLDELEERLSTQRYLVGPQITEADWRLFTTLARFDLVYHTHFKCNHKRLTDYPNLWAYTRQLYQHADIAETVHFDHIVRHYHFSQTTVNPQQIIPINPTVDFTAPHGRD